MILKPNSKFKFIILIFLIVSILLDVYYFNKVSIKHSNPPWEISYSDFKVFWLTARDFIHRYLNDPAYGPVDSRYSTIYDFTKDFYHFRYSPFAVFIFLPFVRLPMGIALLLWSMISNILFLSAILIIGHVFDKEHPVSPDAKLKIFLGIVFLLLIPYLNIISLGQTDILVAFLMALFLFFYVNGMHVAGGIVLALTIHFKPFFLPLILYFALSGKWKLSISAIAAFPLFLLIPMVRPGYRQEAPYLFYEWLRMMKYSVNSQVGDPKNQSFIYMLFKIFRIEGFKGALYAASTVLQLISIGMLLLLQHTRRIKKAYMFSIFEISYIILTLLLASPSIWKAALIYTIIPIAFILYSYAYGIKNRISVIYLGIFFLLTTVLVSDVTRYLVPLNIGCLRSIPFGIMFLLISLCMVYRQNYLNEQGGVV